MHPNVFISKYENDIILLTMNNGVPLPYHRGLRIREELAMLANQIEIRFRDLDGHYSREIIPAQWCIGTEAANVIDEIIAECTAVTFHSVKLFDPNRRELIQ